MNFNLKNVKFISPFTMIISGPSGSGKTHWVHKLLTNHKILIEPRKETLNVLWAYGIYQSLHDVNIPEVLINLTNGLPTENEINTIKPDIIIVDDLMNELSDDSSFGNLFTKVSHHKNISIIFITQNLFHQGKQMRNIHLSSHYLVLLKNTRDLNQIDVLGRQLKLSKEISEAYMDATSKPFGYLILDFKQTTPRTHMMRTRIFPSENIKGQLSPIIYMPR
ncbi:MAG: ATP-binding protein [Limnohabitans sp.]|nr:ATP-binding protein [Limnohabitans sp.]